LIPVPAPVQDELLILAEGFEHVFRKLHDGSPPLLLGFIREPANEGNAQ
jgi:hypothetical protein